MEGTKLIERISLAQRITHLLVALSIITLFITGFPITFSDYLGWFAELIGGYKVTMFLHRVAATCLIFATFFYVTNYILSWLSGRCKLETIIFSPKDILDFIQDLKYTFKLSDELPKYAKFNWLMKASLSYAVFEVFVFIVTGLILWFPWFFMNFMPKSYILAAATIHRAFAIMALLHFTGHVYGNHFHPGEFPLHRVIFSGVLPEEHVKEEFPLWYEEIKEEEGE